MGISINELISSGTLTALVGALISIAWAGRVAWRQISKDKTEIVKDHAEIDIINTLQAQISTLLKENQILRSKESEISNRLGRLESKEQEAKTSIEMIEKLQKKLEDKDVKIEELIKIHAEENTSMKILLSIKDNEIKELYSRINELENRLRKDERDAIEYKINHQ
jgi:chromosome segregation ATPase